MKQYGLCSGLTGMVRVAALALVGAVGLVGGSAAVAAIFVVTNESELSIPIQCGSGGSTKTISVNRYKVCRTSTLILKGTDRNYQTAWFPDQFGGSWSGPLTVNSTGCDDDNANEVIRVYVGGELGDYEDRDGPDDVDVNSNASGRQFDVRLYCSYSTYY